MKIEIPEKLSELFTTIKRYIVIYGGRGSGKSHGVATFLLIKSLEKKCRILCTREIQNSIKDSVWKLLCEKIALYKWDHLFHITENAIVCKKTGSEFIFKGLRGNAQDIKSTEGLQYAWVEEAQTVSRTSLEILVPTVRMPGSQIIFTYNPLTDYDPIHEDYTLKDRDDTLKIQINWRDNPWFPEVLRADLEYDKATNINKYNHIWEGMCVAYENDQIGAFQLVPEWKCQYSVAFIDPSFSDRAGTDSTAVAIVGVQGDLMVFTGMLWQKSISNPDVRRELLDFLNIYTPIETVFESQLSDSAVFFLDVLKREEAFYEVKNLWTVKHQSKGKHERIMATIGVQKRNMRMLEGTQQNFSLEVSRYRKDVPHDDACFVADTLVQTSKGNKRIADIRTGEKVLTPFGFKKVIESGCTGEKSVIENIGLTATRNHKIYNKIKNDFCFIDSLTGAHEYDVISFRGIIKWRLLKLLYLTEKNTENRETIISLMKQQTRDGGIVSSCIKQYGNFIIKKKFLTVFMFTIKTATTIIMTFLTLKLLKLLNIYQIIIRNYSKIKNIRKRIRSNWNLRRRKQKNGIKAKRGENGISNMLKTLLQKHGVTEKKKHVLYVVINSLLKKILLSIVHPNVEKKSDGKVGKNHTINSEEIKEKVYNLKVEGGVYYANGILVSNCDALAGAIEALATSEIVSEYAKAVEIMRRR